MTIMNPHWAAPRHHRGAYRRCCWAWWPGRRIIICATGGRSWLVPLALALGLTVAARLSGAAD
jgi:hypothetical protein